VLHAVVAAYIICFAAGVTLIVVSLLASRRLLLTGLRDFALLFAASTLILLTDAAKTYELAVGSDFGPGLHVAGILLSVAGNAGLMWYLPALALLIVRASPSTIRRVVLSALTAAAALLGGAKEASALVWPGAPVGLLLWNADFVVLLGVHLACGGILLAGFGKIQHPRLRAFVRAFLIYLGVFTVLAVAQLVVQDLPDTPPLLHDHPLEELVYYFGFVIMALIFLARYFGEPIAGEVFSLPDHFMSRFGISQRERDIIQMMAQGLSNSAIADKLYISTVTVKNHVYHIYRKTGAGNKVQLLNMINSLK
jgi:DNA-binding CsgD family transcriptional regulator